MVKWTVPNHDGPNHLGFCSVGRRSLGVPLFFFYMLRKHKETIAKSPKYALISGMRPLYIFFKPSCYMFEVWFMFEKLMLTGVIGIMKVYVGGFFLCNTLSMMTVTYMLCVIVMKRPSKTEPYNVANIISHVLMLITLLTTVALRHPQPEVTPPLWRIPAAAVSSQGESWLAAATPVDNPCCSCELTRSRRCT